jgi:hypothetical protein
MKKLGIMIALAVGIVHNAHAATISEPGTVGCMDMDKTLTIYKLAMDDDVDTAAALIRNSDHCHWIKSGEAVTIWELKKNLACVHVHGIPYCTWVVYGDLKFN